MNNLYLNNNNPIDYTVGSNLVDSMYMGSTMVYSRGGGNPLPKDGVAYVYTKNDEYVLPASLSIDDADNVVGLYFGNSEHQILISLNENASTHMFYIDPKEVISGITTTAYADEAEQDFNGLQNTISLNQYSDDNNSGDIIRAFNYCTMEFAVDGRQGYLPGAGELYFLMQNANVINDAIATVVNKFVNINGRSIIGIYDDTYYWTSTQQSSGRFWCCQKNLSATMSNYAATMMKSRTFFTPGKYECDWYGVKFNGSIPTGTRIGNLEMHKQLPIQSKMRGCTISFDGQQIKYLDPNNWEKYEDGTDRNFRYNTMVEIPEYYCYVSNIGYLGNTASYDQSVILISENPNYGWHKFPKCYIGAYEGVVDMELGGVLVSVRTESIPNNYTEGYHPTKSTSLYNFQSYARRNGNSHWNVYTYEAHKAMTWLFVVEYANRNSQDGFIENLTAEGYRQGGLGPGITTSVSLGDYDYNYCPCGYTDGLGNNTGIRLLSDYNYQANRYRGIENPFGSLWKNVIDVYFANSSNDVFQCKDYESFSASHSTSVPGYEQIGRTITSSAYSTVLSKSNGVCGELYPSYNRNGTTGSSNKYWCDYFNGLSSTAVRTCLIGGRSDHGSSAGLFYLSSNFGLGVSAANVGTRITFYGEPALPDSPTTLELDDEDYEQLDSMESEENWL